MSTWKSGLAEGVMDGANTANNQRNPWFWQNAGGIIEGLGSAAGSIIGGIKGNPTTVVYAEDNGSTPPPAKPFNWVPVGVLVGILLFGGLMFAIFRGKKSK